MMAGVSGWFSRSASRDHCLLAGLAIIEAGLFHAYYLREIVWHQPEHYDQAGLLLESYHLELDIRGHGLGAITDYLLQGHAGGLGLPVEGALMAMLFGGARLPRLAVNFLLFLLAQWAVFHTARRLSGRGIFGFAALGLVLCLESPWRPFGGLFDFRLDMAASCLYGIWVCSLLASDGCLRRKAAAWACVAAMALVLHRLVTATYVIAFYAGWAGLCALAALLLRRQATEAARRLRRRCANAALSLLALVLALAPVLYSQLGALWQYYGQGHIMGPERLARAREQGVISLLDHLLHYPASLLNDHLGQVFLLAALLLLAAAIWQPRQNRPPEAVLTALALLALTILLPLSILTIDVSKSPVVIGIVAFPAALAIVVLALCLTDPARFSVRMAAFLVLLAGLMHGAGHAVGDAYYQANRQDLERTASLNEWLLQWAIDHNVPHLVISADIMVPWFNPIAAGATAYERTGRLVRIDIGLGGRVRAIDWNEATRLISESQILVLSAHSGTGVLPFDQSIAALRPELENEARLHWVLARTIPFENDTLRVYLRPEKSAAPGGSP